MVFDEVRRWLGDLFGNDFPPDANRDLSERIYRRLSLVAALLALLVALPVNALQNIPIVVDVAVFLFGLLAFGLYRAAQRGLYYQKTLFFATLATLNVAWFPNAGTDGSIPYYFFTVAIYPVLFFGGSTRWRLFGLVLANFTVLIVVGLAFPGLLHPFASDMDRAVDLVTGYITSAVACVLMAWVVITAYRREHAQLKVTVDALADSQGLFAGLFQLNPDAQCVIDPERRVFLDANEGFRRLYGWSREETIGRIGPELNLWVDPNDRARLWDAVQRHGTVQGFVARIRARDGRELWTSTSAGLVDHGDTRVLLLTTRDVTPQVEAQRAVDEARVLLSTLIDSTDDMVWLVDPAHGRLLTFNAAFATAVRQTFGVEPSIGQATDEILPAAVLDEWRGFYRRALEQGPFTIEYEPPETGRLVLHTFSPVRHGDSTIGISVFSKDITERKRAEEERGRLELQLLESQKMESLGSLAGGVAHDFNNMLGGILGHADLLLDEEADPGRRERLKAIVSAATRSSDLTRKLLAFGRRGKNIVEAVDLNAIVRDSIAMLTPSFRRDVHVTLRLDATRTVDGDPSQLNQVVVNLCINANEAMPSGGTLTVRTADATLDAGTAPQGLAPGDYVQLDVSDDGVGMSEDVRARIFEPFFTTKAQGRTPGTGLGLSTVYGVVQLHHGAIDVDSTPGSGTTFSVCLPMGALARHQPQTARPARTGQGLVLLVEDEDLLREFMTAAVERLGYRVVTACDGEEAVHVFRDRHREISIILLDLKMPRKDGREAFLEIREIDAAVPVLICSGYGDNEEAQGLISLGAKALLPKPFRPADLAEHLSRLT